MDERRRAVLLSVASIAAGTLAFVAGVVLLAMGESDLVDHRRQRTRGRVRRGVLLATTRGGSLVTCRMSVFLTQDHGFGASRLLTRGGWSGMAPERVWCRRIEWRYLHVSAQPEQMVLV